MNSAVDGNELFHGLREYFDYYNHCEAHQGVGRRIQVNQFKAAAQEVIKKI